MHVSTNHKISQRKNTAFSLFYALYAFFTGFFISTFDIITHVHYFSSSNNKSLALIYLLSGLLGVLVSYVISRMVRTLSAKRISIFILVFALMLSGTYFVLSALKYNNYIVDFGLIILFPVNTLLLLGLWRYGRALLSPAYTKKVFPQIKTAMYTGFAAGGGLIAVWMYFNPFEALNYISLGSLLLLIPLLFLANKYMVVGSGQSAHKKTFVPFKNKMLLFLSNRSTNYLLLFAVLSAAIGFCIHYVFINAAWAGFYTVIGMAKFYGLFVAASAVFLYGIDRYIIKRILFSYDSPYGIVMVPILMLLSLLVAIAGNLFLKNLQPLEHFTVFFLLISMVKVAYITSFNAIQTPSLRTLFHVLDIRFRQIIYCRIESGAIMLGLITTGGLIYALQQFKVFSLTLVLILGLVLSVLCLWLAVRLIRNYRKEQEKVLTRMRFRKGKQFAGNGCLENIRSALNSEDHSTVSEALKLAEQLYPMEYEHELTVLLSHSSERVRLHALACIERNRIDSALPALNENIGSASAEEKVFIEKVVKTIAGEHVKHKDLKHEVYAESALEREKLPYLLNRSDLPDKENLLLALAKDADTSVGMASIRALAHCKIDKFSYVLIDYLHPEQYSPYVIEAIAQSGEQSIEFLEREAMSYQANDLLIARIMRVYGKIGSEKSFKILIDKLGRVNNYLKHQCAGTLVENRFQANKENRYRINRLIIRLIAEQTSFLYKIKYLQASKYELLRNAYKWEVEEGHKHLFKLLSLIYNHNVIDALQNLYVNGSRAQLSHAIELSDRYLDDDIKPLIITLFEDLSLQEKLKRLEFYFPQMRSNTIEVISSTLTYDFNKLSLYPRVCAMLLIEKLELKDFEYELVFNCSHPEQVIQETAFKVLKAIHPDKITEYSNALPQYLFEAYYTSADSINLIKTYIELAQFSVFSSLSENIKLKLAKATRKITLDANDSISINNLSRNFRLAIFNRNVMTNSNEHKLNVSGLLLPLSYLQSTGVNTVHTIETVSIWLFSTTVVTELLYDDTDMANTILFSIEQLKPNRQ